MLGVGTLALLVGLVLDCVDHQCVAVPRQVHSANCSNITDATHERPGKHGEHPRKDVLAALEQRQHQLAVQVSRDGTLALFHRHNALHLLLSPRARCSFLYVFDAVVEALRKRLPVALPQVNERAL